MNDSLNAPAAHWLAPAPQDDLEKKVSEQLPRLKGSIAEAYRAVEQLGYLGPAAIPHLKKAAEGADDRTRSLLAVAEEEIRTAETLKETYAPPKRYTVKGEKRSILDYLNELKTESKENIEFADLVENNYDEVATLDLQDVTFLQALHSICREGKLTINRGGGQTYLYQGAYPDGPKFYFRNFLVSIDTLEHVRVVDFRNPAATTLNLQMRLSWDSQVKPVGGEQTVEILEAVDDKGKNLILPRDPQKDERLPGYPGIGDDEAEDASESGWIGDDSGEMSTHCPLAIPSPDATKIARLRGTIRVDFAKTFDTYTFDKFEPNTEKDGPEFKVVLRSLTPMEWGEYRAEVSFVSKSRCAQEIGQDQRVEIELKLKNGQVMRGNGWSTRTTPTESSFQVEFYDYYGVTFNEEEETPKNNAESLTVRIVRTVVQKKVPFEFTDIDFKKKNP